MTVNCPPSASRAFRMVEERGTMSKPGQTMPEERDMAPQPPEIGVGR